MLGTKHVPDVSATSDIWYVLGMAYDAKDDHPKAIAAFTKALDARRDNLKALFQRGQLYFRKHDNKRAKRDLEAFVRSDTAALAFPVQQANKMLLDLGAK